MKTSKLVSAGWKAFAGAAALVAVLGAGAARTRRPAAAADEPKVDFAKDVQPIFKASCVKCHGLDPKKPKKKPAAKLRLDDGASALAGGRSGKAVVPGDAKDSLLFKLLHGPVPRPDRNEEDKDIAPMPKVKRGAKWKPLPSEQLEVIRRWIDQGADWPEAAPAK